MKAFWKWLDGAAHITPTEVMAYSWGGPNVVSSEIGHAGNAKMILE